MEVGLKTIFIFLLLTTLALLFTAPNLQLSPATVLYHRTLIGFKTPHVNLSPAPAPLPLHSPPPAPAPAPVHHLHRHRLAPIPPPIGRDVRPGRRVLVALLVSAGAATLIISLFALLFMLWKKKSKNTKKVISDPVPKNFYLESLGTVLDPPPIYSFKQEQDSRESEQQQQQEADADNVQHNNHFIMMNSITNSGNLDCSTGGGVVASTEESLKFVEPVFFGSPIAQLQIHVESHDSSDDESFHSFCNSHDSSNPRISDASNTCDTLEPPPQIGKDGTPLPKLKPLHWDKVRAASDRSMVWDKLRSSSFEFDEEMIESLFSYNLHNVNDEMKSKSPSPSKHVLEPKRLQNLTILLKALNVTAEQVCCALVRGNGLNLQQLEVLIKMEPTKEEEGKLIGYKGDMGSAETFVATILTIPYAFLRIEALLYRETFEDEVTHLRKTFSVLEEACKELRSSRLFLKLLEAVLKTGNRMNVGTIRGGAKAFKLDALLKLADIKGTDGKTTLLHFVVQEIVRSEGVRVSESIIGKINQKGQQRNTLQREEDYRNMGLELVAGLSTELCNVKKTATIDFDVIASSVSNLSQGMDRLQRLVSQDLLHKENTCSFGESMKSFMNYSVKHLKELEEEERKVLELVKEITEYFHGSMSKDDANPLRIFVTVRDFLAMLDLVCRELRRSKVFGHPNSIAPFQ
ncbi:putative formin, FH2 domain-containing protein [Helianthus annuus]|nr:putative formin, FH2 domain-containing protein [Helianthus annuus]